MEAVPYERELATALEIVEKVRQPVLDAYARFSPILDARADIKLDVDRDTQETILQHLAAAFPDDGFCAEEDTPTVARTSAESRSRERIWVVDPIDGTRGFAMKNGEFSVMIGLLDGESLALGVVMEPVRERLTYATQGGGCYQVRGSATAVRCRVTTTSVLAEAKYTKSRSSGSGRKSRTDEALAGLDSIRIYSAGIKLALVACGDVDFYINTYPNFHDWDVCAGQLLVEEAGGKVTTLAGRNVIYGKPGADQRNGLLASNGAIHETARAVLS